jgi:hypothetical protein
MGKVIILEQYQNKHLAYKEELKLIRSELKELDERLMTSAINIAAQGEWYEWSEKQGEGAYFEFDTEMLTHCDDVKVQALLALKDLLQSTINALKP